MNIGFFLGHPAHFHYFKNVAESLKIKGHMVFFAVKEKDVLEDLLRRNKINYSKVRGSRKGNRLSMVISILQMDWSIIKFVKNNNIDLMIGVPPAFGTRFICGKPVVVCGEDDADVVPLSSIILLPFASSIIVPTTCNNSFWDKNSVHFRGYMELGYLHPNHFIASKEIVKKCGIDCSEPYFIIRFSSLNAHHDKGIKGINNRIAEHIIEILKPHGKIYITSERPLDEKLEPYRIHINPIDIHHVMAFASLYIGDSQTMAAEAGVLGVPFVRFNDFVGRIGYLRELEDVYHLGYGIRANIEPFTPKKVDWIDKEPKVQPCGAEAMYKVVKELMAMDADERRKLYQERRQKMLSEKIDYAKFLTWFIESYPESVKIMKENPDYQYNFR